jgi:RNA polymerase sigma-70 factor (ECF subfamily)
MAAVHDRGSIETIYEREFDYVWHGLHRLGIPAKDLADVTHDVFLTVLRILDRYDRTRPFRPWLFGVMFRVASDHAHLARHAREILSPPPLSREPSWSPSEMFDAFDEWRIVERALARLPLFHRSVLVMHDLLGYRGPEIASALNILEKTVHSRLTNARSRFIEHAQGLLEAQEALVSSIEPA